jgi:MFS family permease
VVLPLLARNTFHGDGGTYGLFSTMLSVGSVAGSLGVGLVRHPRRVYLLAAVIGFGVCLALTALAPNVPLMCAALLLTGLTGFTFVTMASTTLQLHADPAFRGRVMALWVFVYLGTTPLGSALTGALSSARGPRSALWLGVAACALAAFLAARVKTPADPDAYLHEPPQPTG